MRIGIIGLGFVGDALKHGFGAYGYDNFAVYDPKMPDTSINDIKDTDVAFICVPTPMTNGGTIDPSIVEDTLKNLSDMGYDGLTVIKSTLRPDIGLVLRERYSNLKILSNPEYLTERNARADFLNSEWVVIGGDEEHTRILAALYRKHLPKANIVETKFHVALMAKYMTNVWFSVKVALLNEISQIAQSQDIDWGELTRAFSADTRVGPTHLAVPGPDGDFGFGGKCFPKDLNAFLAWSRQLGTTNNVMSAAWQTNLVVRKNKDWLNIDGAITKDYEG